MKFDTILTCVTKALGTVKLGGKAGDPKLAKLDRGVLQVALMVAALDGTVLPAEYEMFCALAKRARGCTKTNLRRLMDGAIGDAGRLMAMAQIGAYSEKDRLDEFVRLAEEAMPSGFTGGSLADIRRAFALWAIIASSDGEFSSIERKAIDALLKRFAITEKSTLLEDDFAERAVRIARDLKSDAKRSAAESALKELVSKVITVDAKGIRTSRAASAVSVRFAVVAVLVCLGATPAMARTSVSQRDGTGKVVCTVEKDDNVTIVRDGKGRIVSVTERLPDGTVITRDGRGRIQRTVCDD